MNFPTRVLKCQLLQLVHFGWLNKLSIFLCPLQMEANCNNVWKKIFYMCVIVIAAISLDNLIFGHSPKEG